MSQGQIKLDTETARFGRSLGIEDDLESPIDGSSPFRLKRGNTLKRGDSHKLKAVSTATVEGTHMGREATRAASPLREVSVGAGDIIRSPSPLREMSIGMGDRPAAGSPLRGVTATLDQRMSPVLALRERNVLSPEPKKMSARISTVENYHAY